MELSRQGLEAQVAGYKKGVDRPVDLLLRGDAVRKALRDGNLQVKLLHSKYLALVAEMEFNRMKDERINKVKTRVADALGAVTAPNTGGFARCEELANKFYKELSPDADAWEKADRDRTVEHPDFIKMLEQHRKQHVDTADKSLVELSLLVK